MKKSYIMPSIEIEKLQVEAILAGASKLDPNEDNQTVTPTDDEYGGEFGGNRNHRYTWDDLDGEEDN